MAMIECQGCGADMHVKGAPGCGIAITPECVDCTNDKFQCSNWDDVLERRRRRREGRAEHNKKLEETEKLVIEALQRPDSALYRNIRAMIDGRA